MTHWREAAGRQWGVWFLAVFFGVPFAFVGLIVGPPVADRLGALILLTMCSAVGWLGLKALDARVARHDPGNHESS